MKTLFAKNKIMAWVIVILVVLNVSTLATILYHGHQQRASNIIGQASNAPTLETDTEKYTGWYFKNELGFDSNQMAEFRSFNQAFRMQARELTIGLAQKRSEMLEIMNMTNADTIQLNSLSLEIGQMHSTLKVLTYKYYLNLKRTCKPEQQQKLYTIFKTMFQTDARMSFPGGKGMNGMGPGKCGKN